MSWTATIHGFRHYVDLAGARHVRPRLTALFSGRLQILNMLGVTAWFAASRTSGGGGSIRPMSWTGRPMG